MLKTLEEISWRSLALYQKKHICTAAINGKVRELNAKKNVLKFINPTWLFMYILINNASISIRSEHTSYIAVIILRGLFHSIT